MILWRDRMLHETIRTHLNLWCQIQIIELNMIVEQFIDGKPHKLLADCETIYRFMQSKWNDKRDKTLFISQVKFRT